jgi:hypothetical protein
LLTACIVYVQGSAGNLLARCLSLDAGTVPYGKKIHAENRVVEYNNWDSRNWINSEDLQIDYMIGTVPYHRHETSALKLVHRLHPGQFLDGETTLWTADYKWKNLIFIEPNDVDTITKLATLKRTDMDHMSQIKKELEIYNNLLPQATYILPFTDMFDESKFYKHIQTLCNTIDVIYYEEYVKQIWTKWYDETCKLI